jgi:hypothetical protein
MIDQGQYRVWQLDMKVKIFNRMNLLENVQIENILLIYFLIAISSLFNLRYLYILIEKLLIILLQRF